MGPPFDLESPTVRLDGSRARASSGRPLSLSTSSVSPPRRAAARTDLSQALRVIRPAQIDALGRLAC